MITRTHRQLDLTRQEFVERFFVKERPDYVFLAAAKVGGIGANARYPAQFIYQNLAIALNVVHAAWRSRVRLLINLGSSCIYPKHAPQPLREEYLMTGPLEPTNEAYAVAKIAALKLCRHYNSQYGTKFYSLMPTNLYGPNDNFDLNESHVLPAVIRKIHLGKLLMAGNFQAVRKDFSRWSENRDWSSQSEEALARELESHGIHVGKVVLWGSGKPLREFLHVDDLAEACRFLVESAPLEEMGEFVNVGAGKDISIAGLVEEVQSIVGFSGKVFFDDSKPDGTPRKLLDSSKIRSLGWEPKITLEEGIARTYRWYLEQVGKDRIPGARAYSF